MMTVHEVSELTGISVRTLHYYDQIGLLPPTRISDGGYRQYNNKALERLEQILLFRELEFPLKEIQAILDSPSFDRNKALEQQIELLRLKKQHLDNLLVFAQGILLKGVNTMDFKAFDTKEIDRYTEEAKKRWGKTEAYRQFSEKAKCYNAEDWETAQKMLMQNFTAFGELMQEAPQAPSVQNQVKNLQDTISAYYYPCTKEILMQLGQMYAGDGRFSENIDAAAGAGTAEFAARAIAYFCEEQQ